MANDIPLCPAADIDFSKSSFDVEELYLTTRTGTTFTIIIHWPYGGAAVVAEIIKSEQLYPVNQ